MYNHGNCACCGLEITVWSRKDAVVVWCGDFSLLFAWSTNKRSECEHLKQCTKNKFQSPPSTCVLTSPLMLQHRQRLVEKIEAEVRAVLDIYGYCILYSNNTITFADVEAIARQLHTTATEASTNRVIDPHGIYWLHQFPPGIMTRFFLTLLLPSIAILCILIFVTVL